MHNKFSQKKSWYTLKRFSNQLWKVWRVTCIYFLVSTLDPRICDAFTPILATLWDTCMHLHKYWGHSHKAERAVGDQEEFLPMIYQTVQDSIGLIPTENVLLWGEKKQQRTTQHQTFWYDCNMSTGLCNHSAKDTNVWGTTQLREIACLSMFGEHN